jgi:hypothetical protein
MTSELDYNCTSQNIADALNALSNAPADPITCSGSNLVTGFTIVFDENSGAKNLITIWNNTCAFQEVDIMLDVQLVQVGVGPTPCVGTVAHTVHGHGNDAITVTPSILTVGVADTHEGLALPAGAVPGNPLDFSMAIPIGEIYARAEDNGVVLEVTEG